MERKRDGFVPIGNVVAGVELPDGRTLTHAASAPRHHFTCLDQIDQLVDASEADADLGFMARLLALCSLPRTNPGDRKEYVRRNGPYALAMTAGVNARLPYGNLPPCSWRGYALKRCGRNPASWYSAGRCMSSCTSSA